MSRKAGKLRRERSEIESRLRDLDAIPMRVGDPEEIVEAILDGLTHAHQLFEHGSMEERKRVIRAFVERITLDAASRRAELRTKKLPAPQPDNNGNSFESLMGARYEVQQRIRGRGTDSV